MTYYQNIECGNIFPATLQGYKEMVAEAMEMYDYGDPTNPMELGEWYTEIRLDS